MYNLLSVRLLSVVFVLTLCACGGGGGGGGESSAIPAALSLDTSPSAINTGDYVAVTVDISEVNERGILLKLRYPSGLTYVRDSAELTTDEGAAAFPPGTTAVADTYKYLVFFISQATVAQGAEARLTLFLAGTAAVESGAIEVDADIDDPLVPNEQEFKVSNPEFSAEDSSAVVVVN